MKSDTTHSTFAQPEAETAVYLFDDWFDPIETCVRDRVREFIQAMIEGELDATLLRPRYGRLAKHAAADKVVPSAVGHRHGRRSRSLTGTFGRVEIEVPRARLEGANGKTTEWQSKVLRAYQRRTLAADALTASTYLSGTNTPGAPGAQGAIRRRGEQGHSEPDLAQSEGRLGILERPLACRRADRAADP